MASSEHVITASTPLLIVRKLAVSLAFYRDRLAFNVVFASPEDEPFFAMVQRDGVQLMLKEIGPDVDPRPNPSLHPWARWDAYVHTPDPDGLARELSQRGVAFREPVADTDEGLRGFEIADADGYVLFFGRPR